MHKDDERYWEPESFRPERFLNHPLSAAAYANSSNVNARDHFSYGGGKRICVGMHLAERSLFTMTSRLLHIFDVQQAIDTQGRPISVDPGNVRTGLIMAPEPFKARFVYRDDHMKELLQSELKENVESVGDSWWS